MRFFGLAAARQCGDRVRRTSKTACNVEVPTLRILMRRRRHFHSIDKNARGFSIDLVNANRLEATSLSRNVLHYAARRYKRTGRHDLTIGH